MATQIQPQPAAPAPGGGFQFPISQLPPVAGAPQPAQPAVPQPGQPGFNGVPAHLAQPQPQPQPQPQAAAQPAFVPNLGQQPGQQPAPAQLVQAELGMVLQGDHLPPQLRGRTVGDVIAQHTLMMNALRGQQQQQPAQPVVPSQSSMQPAQQPGQQPAAPSNATEFFRDPAGAIRTAMHGERQETVNAVLAALAPVLGPVVQSTMQNQSTAAMNQVANEIGVQRFQQLWPHMQQYIAASPQNTWGSAETWRLAAKAAAGDLVLSGRQLPAQQLPSQQPASPAAPFPVQMVGPHGQPVPGLSSFFTESPATNQPTGRVQLTQLQQQVFQEFQKADPVTWHSPEVYLAWLGGVQPTRR